jgi:formylglycine-generating enzyme required for sulfatase activity
VNLLKIGFASVVFFALQLTACTATGESEELPHAYLPDEISNVSGNSKDSTGTSEITGEDSTKSLRDYVDMVDISASLFTRGSMEYKVSAYSISKTEVTQGLYREIMGSIAKEDFLGDDYPVFNVSWYDAVLFCNALSKKAGLDTAYIYEPDAKSEILKNLSVKYDADAVRLPTEMEWEIAARAGTSTTYYWDTDVASKYAYYAQHTGPVAVAGYEPNAGGLYDMAGNVAEWVGDWFGAYPTESRDNYTGPAEGTYKCVRGGGWSYKAPALASSEREKKVPEYRSQTLGFRIVYSVGF